MLAFKLTLVPLSIFLVSMSGRWWGPKLAGWLAGLPAVVGPLLWLLAMDQGAGFAAQAALLSIAAITAADAYNFTYAWCSSRARWQIALAAGFIAWAAVVFLVTLIPLTTLIAVALAGISVSLSLRYLPRSDAPKLASPLTRTDLIIRMVAGAGLTLAVSTLSGIGWPKVTAAVAAFPLLSVVLSVASHRAFGPPFVVSLLRGMALGRFSYVMFCLSLYYSLQYGNIGLAFLISAVLSLAVHGLTKRWLAHSPRGVPGPAQP
jgi:hypothetical protein